MGRQRVERAAAAGSGDMTERSQQLERIANLAGQLCRRVRAAPADPRAWTIPLDLLASAVGELESLPLAVAELATPDREGLALRWDGHALLECLSGCLRGPIDIEATGRMPPDWERRPHLIGTLRHAKGKLHVGLATPKGQPVEFRPLQPLQLRTTSGLHLGALTVGPAGLRIVPGAALALDCDLV